MKLLLDTCTVLWATLAPATLSPKACKLIADPSNTVLVSAASAWEIATKVRLGKLPGAERFESNYIEVLDRAGYSTLAIDAESALRAGRMTVAHRDPFDRMIAAQALGLDISVVTPDVQFDALGVRRIW
ncbi:MAG: type II toxin-antitoxin system VapC family toxin [Terracidiphilus sp.]|nr:type II toxin-antitoxin system VapC family toxin [Terracidiphilus sp.]